MEFNKYGKIYRIGHTETEDIFKNEKDLIVIEEKIDGGNFRFMILDQRVIIGSRTQQLTSDEGEDTNMNKMFLRCSNYVRQMIKDLDLKKYEGMIFYGENCIKHTLNYNWDEIPPYLGFDIRKDNVFINYEERTKLFQELGLKEAPLVEIKQAKEIKEIDDNIIPISKYAKGKAEGVVFKNYSKQIFAKYVSDAFKEDNALAFGGSPKYNNIDDTNNGDFIFKYCTNARIDKQIFKLLEEGNKLDMPLMKYLSKRVYQDIWEENYQELSTSRWKLDLNKIMKPLTKRCLSVLNQVITNNALEE